MPPQRKSPHRINNAELLASSNFGRNAHIFDDSDVICLLRAAIEREGSITAYARRQGMHRTNVNNILNGKRPVSRTLMKALGLRKVYVADPQ